MTQPDLNSAMTTEDRLARLEQWMRKMNANGMETFANEGDLIIGQDSMVLGDNGISIISATSPFDATQKDRYIQWLDKLLNGNVVAKLGAYYNGGLGANAFDIILADAADSGISIGTVEDASVASPTYRMRLNITDNISSGVPGLFFYSRSTGDATMRQLLEVSPHNDAVTTGRVKIGYDALSTDDIIALVLDNADTTSDLPTASATLRGGLALVEGSPDVLYICRSPDGGSTYEWVTLAAAAGGGMSLIVKEADETVNNSAALQNDNELLFAVAANEVWQFEGVLIVSTGDTPDIAITFTGPTGAVGSFAADAMDVNGVLDGTSAVLGTGGSLAPTGGARLVRFWGGIHNGANAGNLTLQWAQASANGSDTIVRAGSYIKFMKET